MGQARVERRMSDRARFTRYELLTVRRVADLNQHKNIYVKPYPFYLLYFCDLKATACGSLVSHKYVLASAHRGVKGQH